MAQRRLPSMMMATCWRGISIEIDYSKAKLDDGRCSITSETKYLGNEPDNNIGGNSHNEADKTVNETGASPGNLFGIAGTKHKIPADHNEIGKENQADDDENEVDEIETASGKEIADLEGI